MAASTCQDAVYITVCTCDGAPIVFVSFFDPFNECLRTFANYEVTGGICFSNEAFAKNEPAGYCITQAVGNQMCTCTYSVGRGRQMTPFLPDVFSTLPLQVFNIRL